MEPKYWLYSEEFKKHLPAVEQGQPVEAEIMLQDEKVWKPARIMVFRQQAEGTEPAGLLGPFGEQVEQENLFIKVLEELASPLEQD